MEFTQSEQQEEKRMKKSEHSVRDSGDTICGAIFASYGSQKEKSEKASENLFEEIMAKNIPNLGKGRDIQICKAQRIQNKMNP